MKEDNIAGSHYEGDDLIAYWRVIRKRRLFIATLAAISVVSTAFYSIFMTDVYQAAAIIVPVSGKDNVQDRLSAFSQQLGMIPGLSMPASSSSSEIVNTLNSNILRREVIERNGLMPSLFPERWDKGSGAWREEKGGTGSFMRLAAISPWKKESGPPTMWDGVRRLKYIIRVKSNPKDNTITVTADTYDPGLAARLVASFLDALNDHMSGESRRVADSTRRYLEGQLRTTADPLIRQKIYNLIAQQIEVAMMSEVKENFAFKVIDPPQAPDRKVGPKRLRMVSLSLALSLFAGAFFSFFIEYSERMKKNRQIL